MKICFLWDFGLNILSYAKTNSARLSKLILECPLEIFRKKCFFPISRNFLSLSYFGRNFLSLLMEKKEGLSNQPLTYGEHHSEGKMKTPQIFSFRVLTPEKNCRIFYGRLAILFLEHRNTLRKTVSVNIYFLSFWDFECNFSVFCKTISARLPEFLFTCPEKNFCRKKCIKMQKFLVFSFLHRKRIFEKNLADLSKVYSFCPLY